LLAALAVASSVGCSSGPPAVPGRAPLAQKWLDRAKAEYAEADVDDAADAIKSALQVASSDVEVRTWAGRIALARLEYAEVQQVLAGVDTSDARGLRGRAHWYAGEIEAAADELEAMLQDPDVKDAWAKAIAGLARRGAGRTPFQMRGGLVGAVDMPRVLGTTMVVPLEIDGEQALAVVATGTAEVTLDSASRKEPSWVSLRFADRVEVQDVPAMVQDLSGISRQLNAPIKALLGVNFLRRAHVTFDFTGSQFVVRTSEPAPPPAATRVPVWYAKGGGMVVRSAFTSAKDAPGAALIVDTSLTFPLALDEAGWKKAGIAIGSLQPSPSDPKAKQGVLPLVRLGAFDVPQVPAVLGPSLADIEKGLEMDLDGILGSGLLGAFRVTLGDGGRSMWIEDLPGPPESPPPPPEAPQLELPEPRVSPGAVAPPPAAKPGSKPATKPGAKPPRGGAKPSD
jgi:hypothetical protein